MRAFLKENDMMAYLSMMAVRLLELHRVLKPTGSLYLHCDPTASHYLKTLMDAIFGPENFGTRSFGSARTQEALREGGPESTMSSLSTQGRRRSTSSRSQVPADKEKLPHTLITLEGVKYQT